MDTKTQSSLASALTLGVGAWMLLVPAFTSVTGGALVSILITGGVIALAGLVQLFWENTLPSWVSGLAAVWLITSALIFDISTTVVWNMVLGAAAAFILALWDGAEVSNLHHAHRQHV